jgi:hypothetical protein
MVTSKAKPKSQKQSIKKKHRIPFALEYLIAAYGIAALVWGMNFYTTLSGVLVLAVMIVLFIHHHLPWGYLNKINKPKTIAKVKIVVSLAALCAFGLIVKAPLKEQWVKDYHQKTTSFLQSETPIIGTGSSAGHAFITPGCIIGINVPWKNTSSERAFDVFEYSEGIVLINPSSLTNTTVIQQFSSSVKTYKADYLSGKLKTTGDVGIGHYVWESYFTKPLSIIEYNGLFNGLTRIYILSYCVWKDSAGTIDSSVSCYWLSPLPKRDNNMYAWDEVAWHMCQTNK